MAYLAQHASATRFTALFQFAASVPLVVFGAAAAARLRRLLGAGVAGPVIGLVGAVVASAAVSALAQWRLSRVDPEAPLSLLVALRDLGFVAVGAWHTVALGLLVAGIAGARVVLPPASPLAGGRRRDGRDRLRAATLSLVLPAFSYVIPLGRFPALLWLLAAAVLLPIARRSGAPPMSAPRAA